MRSIGDNKEVSNRYASFSLSHATVFHFPLVRSCYPSSGRCHKGGESRLWCLEEVSGDSFKKALLLKPKIPVNFYFDITH